MDGTPEGSSAQVERPRVQESKLWPDITYVIWREHPLLLVVTSAYR